MKRKTVLIRITTLFLAFLLICILMLSGYIKITPFFAAKYELDGIDVSHYQGDIDWNKIEEQGIDFAFIKVTEGSSHVDQCFEENWKRAGQTSLMTGAYHFFSFDSEGKTQAEHFIGTAGDLQGKLAPVIDVEYYGEKEKNPPNKADVQAQLAVMLDLLEEQYHVKPIIYTTYKAYRDFIKGEFEEYPLWIRNVYYPPVFIGWTFWQYTDKDVLDGYQGSEKYIDRNVFRGSMEEMDSLMVPASEEKSERLEDWMISDSKKENEKIQVTDSFTVQEMDGTERIISLPDCNCEYEEKETLVYSYLGLKKALYIFTPETEKVIYPIKDFVIDQDQDIILLLENGEALQISRTDLSDRSGLEKRIVVEYEDFVRAFAETYGLSVREDGISFYDLNVWFTQSKKEYEGDSVLKGTACSVYYETGERYYLAFEVDVMSDNICWFGSDSFFDIPSESEGSSLTREEVFSMVEKGDFSFVDMSRIRQASIQREDLEEELKNNEIEFIRCDVDRDGLEELIWQVEDELWPNGMVQYIFDYKNGWVVGIYYDGWDGNEWLTLGQSGKLYDNLVITASYYVEAYYTCCLDTAGYKEIEYGLEIITISDQDGINGLVGNYPELVEKYPGMAKEGVYYLKVRSRTSEEINQYGSASGRVEELITEEEFREEYQELTGLDFIE